MKYMCILTVKTCSIATEIIVFLNNEELNEKMSCLIIVDVRSIADLSIVVNMSEPMVRQYYDLLMTEIRSLYRGNPGQDIIPEIIQVWSISKDIVEFDEQVSGIFQI